MTALFTVASRLVWLSDEIPGDPELNFNLGYAREQTKDAEANLDKRIALIAEKRHLDVKKDDTWVKSVIFCASLKSAVGQGS